MTGHRCAVRRLRGASQTHGVPALWESRCQQSNTCGRYLTVGGWVDAMVHAVAHYYGSAHGWVQVTDGARSKVGWR